MHFATPNFTVTKKVAGFDLDGTLIRPKSKRRFPKDKDDWMLCENVAPTLNSLYKAGYTILVFTNQKNLEKRITKEDFKEKCMNIQKELQVPIAFYIAIHNDYQRKPFPGMFETFKLEYNCPEESFYVGDAWSKTECFSDSDLCFAKNCNIPFYRAHEFFKSEDPQIYNPDFIELFDNTKISPSKILKLQTFQYIFLVGSPASGKTTFCTLNLPNHLRLSKDDYKTPAKYRNAIKDAIKENKQIVFDNTNASEASRDKIIDILDISKQSDIAYIIRNITKKQAFYLNKYRYFTTRRKFLPDVAIHTYFKRCEMPTGSNIFTINSGIEHLRPFYC